MTPAAEKGQVPEPHRLFRLAWVVSLALMLILLDFVLVPLLRRQRLPEPGLGEPVPIRVPERGELVLLDAGGNLASIEPKHYAGRDVAAVFMEGRLSKDTATELREYLGEPVPATGSIKLFTSAFEADYREHRGESWCLTSIAIDSKAIDREGLRLHVSRPTDVGEEPAVRLRPEGGRLKVSLTVVAPPARDPGAPQELDPFAPAALGCLKELEIGGTGTIPIPAPWSLEIFVPPGESATLVFPKLHESAPEVIAPLRFNKLRSLKVRRRVGGEVVVSATGGGGDRDIEIDQLTLDRSGLTVAIEGTGSFVGDPDYLPEDRAPLARLRGWLDYHLVLTVVWAALLGYAGRLLTKHLLEDPGVSEAKWLQAIRSRTARRRSAPPSEAGAKSHPDDAGGGEQGEAGSPDPPIPGP